jgi:hypothetical protein
VAIQFDYCFLVVVGWFMVFNATFKSISVISWRSVLLMEKSVVPELENNNQGAAVVMIVW